MATQRKRKVVRMSAARPLPRPRRKVANRAKDTRRRKISTTIAPEGYAFLREIIRSGKARTVARAIDLVLDEMRRLENRERLERMTEEAYANMSAEALGEEKEIVEALSQSVGEIDFDE